MIVQKERVLKKTDNISIRIDSDLRNKLNEKCQDQKISLNTLINHLLEKQVNWNELTDEIGWVSMFRTTFRELMEQSPTKKIEEIPRDLFCQAKILRWNSRRNQAISIC